MDQKMRQPLSSGAVDVGFFLGPPDDELVQALMEDPHIKLMEMDNAEAMQRKTPISAPPHSLRMGPSTWPKNLPPTDADIVAPTATILAKKNIHSGTGSSPLRAATAIHSERGCLRKSQRVPLRTRTTKSTLDEKARGSITRMAHRLRHRYLPFWLATLLERLVIVAVPFFGLVLPALKTIPRFFNWRARRKILGRYAELKFIEIKIFVEIGRPEKLTECVNDLRKIEEKVRHLRVPPWNLRTSFTDYVRILKWCRSRSSISRGEA